MLPTALIIALALAAPPEPAGPPPRLVSVGVGEGGRVTVPVTRSDPNARQVLCGFTRTPFGTDEKFQAPLRVETTAAVPLGEVKGLTITTAGGEAVTAAEAGKRLAKGGTVAVSADGKAVDPRHLKALREDTLVLVAADLADPPAGLAVPTGLEFLVVPGTRPAPVVASPPPPPGK